MVNVMKGINQIKRGEWDSLKAQKRPLLKGDNKAITCHAKVSEENIPGKDHCKHKGRFAWLSLVV